MKKLITITICLVMAIELLTGSGIYANAEKLPISQSSVNLSEKSQDSIAAVEINHVNASIDSNKKVTVRGVITSGAGQQITLRITDPKGNLEYVDNTTSTTGGKFMFSYIMTNQLFGKYNVSIGGTGISTPATASFNFGIDADLSNLSLNGTEFDKAFAAGITSYTASLDNSVTSVTVTPTLSDTNAKVMVENTSVLSGQASNPISLKEGTNTINVVVTAQDGITSKTYVIAVVRKKVTITAAASIDSNKKVTVNGVITSGAGQQVTLRITDPKGNLEHVNNTTSTTGGNFTFSYTLTNKLCGKYNVSLGGAGISDPAAASFNFGIDADLSNLSLNGGTFDQTFAAGITSYTASVDNSVTSITVTPTLSDTNAKVSVEYTNVLSGQASVPINLKEGSNKVNVIVTALDGITTKAYTITVVRNKAGVTSVTNVNASIDNNKKVTVTGAVSSKAGKLITVRITDPKGNLEYINNTVSTMTGNFTFSYTMANTLKGRYNVAIGGTGIVNPAATYFYYGPDADLNNLILSSGVLCPDFAADTISYTVNVNCSVSDITVTPTLSDIKAAVSVNTASVLSGQASAPVSLNYRDNIINVVVTAQDTTTTKTYTINVNREVPPQPTPTPQPTPSPEPTPDPSLPPQPSPPPDMSSDATLSSLLIKSNDIDIKLYSDSDCKSPTVFAPGTTSYYASVADSMATITVTPTLNDIKAAVSVNATKTLSWHATVPINLQEGSNTINVVVTAQDGITIKTYTINVYRAAQPPIMSSDATLNSLSINGGGTYINFDPETTAYNATVVSGTDFITITPIVNEIHAAVTVNETTVANGVPKTLLLGDLMYNKNGIINIVVTAQDGTKKTYTITISVVIPPPPPLLSNDATLSNLVLNGGGISIAFNPEITDYNAAAAGGTDIITVTPTVNEANATVAVNEVLVANGDSVSLPVGDLMVDSQSGQINVVVTAQDGTKKTYTVTISL